MDRYDQEARFYAVNEALRNERLARVREPLLDATSNLLVSTVTVGIMEAGQPSNTQRGASPEELGIAAERESNETLRSLGGVAAIQTIEPGHTAPANPERYATGYGENRSQQEFTLAA